MWKSLGGVKTLTKPSIVSAPYGDPSIFGYSSFQFLQLETSRYVTTLRYKKTTAASW